LWEILSACWQKKPDARPNADEIVTQLYNIIKKLGGSDIFNLYNKANAILISTNKITEESVDIVIKQLKV
jgi:hypothetical protein